MALRPRCRVPCGEPGVSSVRCAGRSKSGWQRCSRQWVASSRRSGSARQAGGIACVPCQSLRIAAAATAVVCARDCGVARDHWALSWFQQYAPMCGTGAEVALVPCCGWSCVVVVVAVVSRRERRVVCMSIPRHALMCDIGPLLSSRDRGRGAAGTPSSLW